MATVALGMLHVGAAVFIDGLEVARFTTVASALDFAAEVQS